MASEQAPTKLRGRPRVEADIEILLEYRSRGLGWVLAAETYRKETGQFISPSTVRRVILKHQEKGGVISAGPESGGGR